MLFQCLSEARLSGVHEVRLLVPMSFDALTAVLVSRSKPLVVSGTPGLYQAFWCPRTWKSHVSVYPVNCARRNTPTAMAVATAAAGMFSLVGDWFGGRSGVSQEAISNAGFKSAREVPSEVLSAHFFFGANGAWSKYLGVLGESPVMAGCAVLPCWSRSVGPCGATRLFLRPGAV